MRLMFVASVAVVAACSKPSSNKDTGAKPVTTEGAKVMVPGGDTTGAPRMTMDNPEGAGQIGGDKGAAARGGADDSFRLKPEEGKLAVEAPADAKAGTEVTAKILVTPVGPYKINKEFPTKLTLETPTGVTIAKAQLTAGGHDQSKGDADAFEDKQLAFTVKLTPTSGNHTINGTFKFAVCDKDTCLAKKEQISIAVAAK